MKTWLMALLMVGLAATWLPTTSHAKRLGGGKPAGMQRSAPDKAAPSAPATPAATPGTPAATPNTPAAAAAPATTVAAAATFVARAGGRACRGPGARCVVQPSRHR
jgi:hypothetical protein